MLWSPLVWCVCELLLDSSQILLKIHLRKVGQLEHYEEQAKVRGFAGVRRIGWHPLRKFAAPDRKSCQFYAHPTFWWRRQIHIYYIRYSDLNRIDHSTILWPRHFRQYMQHALLDCVLSTYVCTQYKNAKIDNCRPAARALISSKIINQNNYKKKVSRLTPVHAKCTAQSPNPSFSHSPKATSSSSISWIQRRTLIIFLLGRSSCLIHTSILCNFYQNTSHEESSSHVLESFRPMW